MSPRGKRRRGPPRWLVLLAGGVALGAAGVLVAQEKWLPPRLSASESAQLRSTLAHTEDQRQQLDQSLADTSRRLDAALEEKKTLSAELEASRRTVEQLRRGLASVVESLPPDPRGGAVQVRAARFKAERGQLLYDVVLSRERANGAPRNAVMQLVVAGARRGAETSVKLQPVALTLGAFETLSGGLPLPEGFDARQATVHVLDRPEGRLLGMRVLLVK
ncbi:MAG: hypothetical protein AB1430_04675 [Pseudomonadota bacterium]